MHISGFALASTLNPEHIGFFGFSRGGYTGLVVAGGNPDLRKLTALCPEDSPTPNCAQLRRNEIPALAFTHDPRILRLPAARGVLASEKHPRQR